MRYSIFEAQDWNTVELPPLPPPAAKTLAVRAPPEAPKQAKPEAQPPAKPEAQQAKPKPDAHQPKPKPVPSAEDKVPESGPMEIDSLPEVPAPLGPKAPKAEKRPHVAESSILPPPDRRDAPGSIYPAVPQKDKRGEYVMRVTRVDKQGDPVAQVKYSTPKKDGGQQHHTIKYFYDIDVSYGTEELHMAMPCEVRLLATMYTANADLGERLIALFGYRLSHGHWTFNIALYTPGQPPSHFGAIESWYVTGHGPQLSDLIPHAHSALTAHHASMEAERNPVDVDKESSEEDAADPAPARPAVRSNRALPAAKRPKQEEAPVQAHQAAALQEVALQRDAHEKEKERYIQENAALRRQLEEQSKELREALVAKAAAEAQAAAAARAEEATRKLLLRYLPKERVAGQLETVAVAAAMSSTTNTDGAAFLSAATAAFRDVAGRYSSGITAANKTIQQLLQIARQSPIGDAGAKPELWLIDTEALDREMARLRTIYSASACTSAAMDPAFSPPGGTPLGSEVGSRDDQATQPGVLNRSLNSSYDSLDKTLE